MSLFKNRTVVGVSCILFSLLVCFGITPMFNRQITQKTEIVRVAKDIKAGDKITKDMIQSVEVGSYHLPETVIKSTETVVGCYALADLSMGDYIINSKVSKTPSEENAYLYHLDVHFESPEHAINVIRRMLHVSGIVLDNASPAVLGHLSKNIRIAVLKTPLVDEDVGIAASIRIVNPQSMQKKDFVRSGTATEQMLDFLSNLIRYGISVCVAGATSSGKTTVLGWLLTTIPDNKRIYTIENGSRELDLTRFEEGKVVNSVIHTITRDSENDKQKVDQIMLLDMALHFNPDIAVVGEMRGAEANAAQEAARTGIAVLTTIHANSCEATYRRMVSLCKRAVDMSDETLMGYVTEAYPIIVFCKQLENKQRRMMEIMECEILPDGTRNYRTLFQYVITENRMDEKGEFIIEGYHEQKSCISESLSKRLLENGMPVEMINSMKRREEESE